MAPASSNTFSYPDIEQDDVLQRSGMADYNKSIKARNISGSEYTERAQLREVESEEDAYSYGKLKKEVLQRSGMAKERQ